MNYNDKNINLTLFTRNKMELQNIIRNNYYELVNMDLLLRIRVEHNSVHNSNIIKIIKNGITRSKSTFEIRDEIKKYGYYPECIVSYLLSGIGDEMDVTEDL